MLLFFYLACKPRESLKQIAAFDVEKLLSKLAILSENLLLQLWQSLTKEWGAGSISTLPKDFHPETSDRGMVLLETAIILPLFTYLHPVSKYFI